MSIYLWSKELRRLKLARVVFCLHFARCSQKTNLSTMFSTFSSVFSMFSMDDKFNPLPHNPDF